MLNLSRLDPDFTDKVLAEPGGEHLFRCYSCGTCMSACLVKRYNEEFNPRRLIRMVALGLQDKALTNPTYWLCSACDACYERCPQEIHISDVMKAVRTVAIREGYEPPFATAEVDTVLCSGCSTCARVCPYEAIAMVEETQNGEVHTVSSVDANLCMACGICAATCPSLAITAPDYSHLEVLTRLGAGGWLDAEFDETKLAVFVCNWSLRAEEDVALQDSFPSNVRVVNVPCSGRVDPLFLLFALRGGVDGALVIGCRPGECHFKEGNYIEHSRLSLLGTVLGQVGIDKRRVRFERLGAADRGRFEQVVEGMLTDVAALNGGAS
jgi:heterodisulfide reductase subunit C